MIDTIFNGIYSPNSMPCSITESSLQLSLNSDVHCDAVINVRAATPTGVKRISAGSERKPEKTMKRMKSDQIATDTLKRARQICL